ncbi:hypothetical protein [Streptosporangium sp. NPDC023615]|uniref:ATP-binding protein n=1 Tax=Streptosporangium sp. NPDC023615 TaxID=3154794 RepID=UPI00341854B2
MPAEPAPALDTGACTGAGGRFRTTVWCLPPGNAARRARELLRGLLSRPPFAADEVADLEVVVTELATNAAGHAPGPYELRVLYDRGPGHHAHGPDAHGPGGHGPDARGPGGHAHGPGGHAHEPGGHGHGLPVRVEVVDAGGGAPLIERLLRRPFSAPEEVEELELGGRGLRIVGEFTAGRCGARRTRLCGTGRLGTGVWFDLPAHPPHL